MRSAVSITMLLLGVLIAGPIAAQALYRCGSAYQDRPCASGQSKVVVNGAAAPALASAKPSSDAACVQHGIDAQKIVWRREGGATAEQLFDKTRSESERTLIAEVYRQRGTSTEIRVRIEADCVAEKKRAANARALLEAANLTPAPSPAPMQASQPASQSESDAAARTAARVSGDAERKKSDCERLRRQNQNIIDSQRAGGNVATMESLNRQRAQSEATLQRAGC